MLHFDMAVDNQTLAIRVLLMLQSISLILGKSVLGNCPLLARIFATKANPVRPNLERWHRQATLRLVVTPGRVAKCTNRQLFPVSVGVAGPAKEPARPSGTVSASFYFHQVCCSVWPDLCCADLTGRYEMRHRHHSSGVAALSSVPEVPDFSVSFVCAFRESL